MEEKNINNYTTVQYVREQRYVQGIITAAQQGRAAHPARAGF